YAANWSNRPKSKQRRSPPSSATPCYTSALSRATVAPMTTEQRSKQPMDVEAVRAQIPALQGRIYLNAGGIGPTPLPVTETLVRLARQVSEEGPDGMAFSREAFTGAQATREKVAR